MAQYDDDAAINAFFAANELDEREELQDTSPTASRNASQNSPQRLLGQPPFTPILGQRVTNEFESPDRSLGHVSDEYELPLSPEILKAESYAHIHPELPESYVYHGSNEVYRLGAPLEAAADMAYAMSVTLPPWDQELLDNHTSEGGPTSNTYAPSMHRPIYAPGLDSGLMSGRTLSQPCAFVQASWAARQELIELVESMLADDSTLGLSGKGDVTVFNSLAIERACGMRERDLPSSSSSNAVADAVSAAGTTCAQAIITQDSPLGELRNMQPVIGMIQNDTSEQGGLLLIPTAFFGEMRESYEIQGSMRDYVALYSILDSQMRAAKTDNPYAVPFAEAIPNDFSEDFRPGWIRLLIPRDVFEGQDYLLYRGAMVAVFGTMLSINGERTIKAAAIFQPRGAIRRDYISRVTSATGLKDYQQALAADESSRPINLSLVSLAGPLLPITNTPTNTIVAQSNIVQSVPFIAAVESFIQRLSSIVSESQANMVVLMGPITTEYPLISVEEALQLFNELLPSHATTVSKMVAAAATNVPLPSLRTIALWHFLRSLVTFLGKAGVKGVLVPSRHCVLTSDPYFPQKPYNFDSERQNEPVWKRLNQFLASSGDVLRLLPNPGTFLYNGVEIAVADLKWTEFTFLASQKLHFSWEPRPDVPNPLASMVPATPSFPAPAGSLLAPGTNEMPPPTKPRAEGEAPGGTAEVAGQGQTGGPKEAADPAVSVVSADPAASAAPAAPAVEAKETPKLPSPFIKIKRETPVAAPSPPPTTQTSPTAAKPMASPFITRSGGEQRVRATGKPATPHILQRGASLPRELVADVQKCSHFWPLYSGMRQFSAQQIEADFLKQAQSSKEFAMKVNRSRLEAYVLCSLLGGNMICGFPYLSGVVAARQEFGRLLHPSMFILPTVIATPPSLLALGDRDVLLLNPGSSQGSGGYQTYSKVVYSTGFREHVTEDGTGRDASKRGKSQVFAVTMRIK